MTFHYALHTPADLRVFVFGSNLRGIHGAGAARYARLELGAVGGQGEGLQGRSYAIPTCFAPGRPLPLRYIESAVDLFLVLARATPNVRYFVSRIGCGLAGYSDDEIAPMFAGAPDNCDLPPGWREM